MDSRTSRAGPILRRNEIGTPYPAESLALAKQVDDARCNLPSVEVCVIAPTPLQAALPAHRLIASEGEAAFVAEADFPAAGSASETGFRVRLSIRL